MLPSPGGLKATCFFERKHATATKTGTCKMQQQTQSHTAKHAAHSSLAAFLLSSPGPEQRREHQTSNQSSKASLGASLLSSPRSNCKSPAAAAAAAASASATASAARIFLCFAPIFDGARQFQPLNSRGARKDMGSAFNPIHSLQCISLLSSVSR